MTLTIAALWAGEYGFCKQYAYWETSMKLYDYFRSSASYRVRIALHVKGLAYEPVAVNLLTTEQRSEAHLARNPQGFVPALEVASADGQQLITQSLAICEYLDEAYPETPSLLPGDALVRSRIRSLAQIVACDIHPLDNLRVLNYLVTELGLSEDQKMTWYRHWIQQGFAALESRLAQSADTGMFCHGDSVTLADVCLVPQVYNAKRFAVDMSPYPTIQRINAACLALPSFQQAQPE